MKKVGIIGGSGFYDLPGKDISPVDTPWGKSGKLKVLENDNIVFLARHGSEHSVPPHQVNFRANIYALKSMNVDFIIATNAVGSCAEKYKPGDYAIPDNVLDLTHSRGHTFFEHNPKVPSKFQQVVHTDVTSPFSSTVRQTISSVFKEINLPFHNEGTIVVFNGPRFETSAEVRMAQILGGHLLGMTTAPEVFLAKELDLKYATIAVVTNYGAGLQQGVSHDEVVEMFKNKIETLKEIVLKCANTLLSL